MNTTTINKMGTTAIVNKIVALTNKVVTAIELQTLSRDELKTVLTALTNTPDVIDCIYNFDDILTIVYGDDGADADVVEAIVAEKTIEEKLAECFIDDENLFGEDGADEDVVTVKVGRTAQFSDAKLRKAFRTMARAKAKAAGVDWEKVGEDYIVNGELISWANYIAEKAS